MFDRHRLDVLLADREMSLKELAKAIGISESAMYAKANGKREFTRAEIKDICRIIEVSPMEIFFTEKLA